MASGAVRYVNSLDLWQGYSEFLLETAHRNGVSAVAELGGGANPVIADTDVWGFVPKRVVFDISAEELAKSDGDVEKRVADLSKPLNEGLDSYDLIFSKMLCEHLPDAEVFHRNCFNLLRGGGVAVHFFPTLFATPFIVNRIIPEGLGASILGRIDSRRVNDPRFGKFPALYKWCTGPTQKTLQRYRGIGFEIAEWRGGFGHEYYNRIAPLAAVERAKTRFLLKHPQPMLTSYAVVVLRKPA